MCTALFPGITDARVRQATCAASLGYAKLVFVTDSLVDGNFGGVSAADAICQDSANLVGLPGIYKAWVSSVAEGSPSQNFNHSVVPYVLVDSTQTQIAANWADLTDTVLSSPIDTTESGLLTAAPTNDVWTNTQATGIIAAANGGHSCSNWTSIAIATGVSGKSTNPNSGFSLNTAGYACSSLARFYCFQQ